MFGIHLGPTTSPPTLAGRAAAIAASGTTRSLLGSADAMTTTGEQLNSALTGRFAVERLLGRGGMSSVFLARDLRHDRLVALKVLRPSVAATLGAEPSLEGQIEQAIQCLEDAFALGFANRDWIVRDPGLEPLRGHPRFEALLARR